MLHNVVHIFVYCDDNWQNNFFFWMLQKTLYIYTIEAQICGT